MKNKPIYLWPFIILYKTPLLILHYLFTGIVFTLMAISFTWWKLVKWFMFGISFPIVIIGRAFKGDKKKNNIAKEASLTAAAGATAAVLNAGAVGLPSNLSKDEKELAKLKAKDEKEALAHEKKMAELKRKEDIKAAKEKEKLEKLNKKKEAEAKEQEKIDAENQLKEQQALLKEAERKKKQQEAIEKQKKQKDGKPLTPAQEKKAAMKQAKLDAAEEKKRLKEEKIKRKKELKDEKKKLQEKNTYVNENVTLEKKKVGDYINDGLEKMIAVPKKLKEKAKDSIKNSSFARNKRNEEDMQREALLIDFNGDDATKSDKKVVYEYVGKNAEGKIVKNYFEAFSKVEVHSFLLSEGYEVYSIRTSSWIQFFHGTKQATNVKFKMKDLLFFLTQLSTYIKAGIPLVEALRILSRQFQDKSYQKLFRALIYDLTMGDNFSIAMEKQGNAFPKILVNMVKASEMTGELPEALDDMQLYFEESDKTKKQMITALTYPAIVFTLAIVALVFIMLYIVPQFVDIYADMDNAELPGITVFILNLSELLQTKWMYIIAVIVVVIVVFSYLFKNVKLFRTLIQWCLMHVPVIGDVIIYNEVTMFTKTFASLLKHNVFITDTMEILNKITNNEIWKMIILDTITNLAKGEKISLAFQDHWAVPVPAYEMIVTGERTGQLPEMMQKVSDYYQELHKNAVGRIKSFVEPILILFLTGAVGVIVLSIVIPMFDMYSQLG